MKLSRVLRSKTVKAREAIKKNKKFNNIDELLVDVQPALEQNREMYKPNKFLYAQPVVHKNCFKRWITMKSQVTPEEENGSVNCHNSERARENWSRMKMNLLKELFIQKFMENARNQKEADDKSDDSDEEGKVFCQDLLVKPDSK